MPLRLAGEDYAVVQGLDDLGRLRAIVVNDASPGLTIDQQGAGTLLELQAAGASRLALTSGGRLDLPIAGSGGGLLIGSDAGLYRGAADVLQTDDALRLGGHLYLPNAKYLHFKDTGGTDQPALYLSSGDILILQNPVASRALQLATGGVKRAELNAITGDLSLGTQQLLFGTFGAEDVTLYRSEANVLRTDDLFQATGGLLGTFLQMNEQAGIAAPSADSARMYAEDNGAGKTRVVVRFATGAAQVIATEP